MKKYDYNFIGNIDPFIKKRIDAFIIVCKVLDKDDVELYISASNIIENILKILSCKKGFSTKESLEEKTYYEIITNVAFSSYLEALKIDVSFVHKIRKIRNSQHDFSGSNLYLNKKELLKGVFDVAILTYNALFGKNILLISMPEVDTLLLDNQINEIENISEDKMKISEELIKNILSKAIDLLFSSGDIEEIISKSSTTNSNSKNEESKVVNETSKISVDKTKKSLNNSTGNSNKIVFKKILKEKQYIKKPKYKSEIKGRKKNLEEMLSSKEPDTNNPKYKSVLERGYVEKGELTAIRLDLKARFAVLMKIAKQANMVSSGFPGSAYDTALWNIEYVSDNVLTKKEILVPICYDITIVCNMDFVKQDKTTDPFFIYKLAVDLINRIDSISIEIVGKNRAIGLLNNEVSKVKKNHQKSERKLEKQQKRIRELRKRRKRRRNRMKRQNKT